MSNGGLFTPTPEFDTQAPIPRQGYQYRGIKISEQFQGEQYEDRHGGVLTWPGHPEYGVPVLGTEPLDLKPLLPAELDTALVFMTHQYVRVFDLGNEDHLEYYTWVMRRVRAGWFHLDSREHLADLKETEGTRVLLEWTQIYFKYKADGEKDELPPTGGVDYKNPHNGLRILG